MKKRVLFFISAFLIMALLPLISARGSIPKEKENDISESQMSNLSENGKKSEKESSESKEIKTEDNKEYKSFKIFDTSSGNITEVDDRTFCIGATAYEMPATFDEEALKAQCIACYTHFSKLRENQRNNPDDGLKGADFKADLSKNEYYISDEEMKEKFGNMYESCKERLERVVDEVFGTVLTDDSGNLIDVSYFAISSGVTESSKDIFGYESDYLVPVASPLDVQVSGYLSEKSVSEDEFKNILISEDKDIRFEKSAEDWIKSCERTGSGTVKKIKIGSGEFDGSKIRELFGLRSANFDLEYKDKTFMFTVYGYGHGVGMSQYGAEYMARQGADCREILNHYYNKCLVVSD